MSASGGSARAIACLREYPANGGLCGGVADEFDPYPTAYVLSEDGCDGIGDACDQTRNEFWGVRASERLLMYPEGDRWRCRRDGFAADAQATWWESDQLHDGVWAGGFAVDVNDGVSKRADQGGLAAVEVVLECVDGEVGHAYLLREWSTGIEVSFVVKDIVSLDSGDV